VVIKSASAPATDEEITATASIIFIRVETLFFEACRFFALLES
jgi:hypothetical protein